MADGGNGMSNGAGPVAGPASGGTGGRRAGAAHGLRVPIWSKIAAALVVPLLAVGAVSWLQVGNARADVDRIDEETGLAATALSPGGLVNALIIERGDVAASLVGQRESTHMGTPSIEASFAGTDDAVASLEAAVAEGGPVAEATYRPVLDRIDTQLPAFRDAFANAPQPYSLDNLDMSPELYDDYSGLLDALTAANARLTGEITDPELRAAATALDGVNRLHDDLSNVTQKAALGATLGWIDLPEYRDEVVRLADAYDRAVADLASQRTGPWSDEVEAFSRTPNYGALSRANQAILDGEPLDLPSYLGISPDAGPDPENPRAGTAQAVAVAAEGRLAERIDALRAGARRTERNYLAGSVVVVLGAALVASLIARSVTRPMRRLTDQARAMAAVRLPGAVQGVLDTPAGEDVVVPEVAPIVVDSHDEVRDVAAALNMVQRSALDLAVEQATLRRNIADSFTSLGRRTQNLIGLQLELITELEHEETDPTLLEHLYRLDHLATRARRNAESLVVLAGTEPARTRTAPVGVHDVVRACLSEVEGYQRVEIAGLEDAQVPGSVAADLIHLLAELVENGLTFSPPSRPVEVRGRFGPGGYTLVVTDSGVGMGAAELERANRRLSGNETFTVAPSRYLGHYVAGRLADRIGAAVSLLEAPTGGVAAKVTIPGHLVSVPEAQPEPAPGPLPVAAPTGAGAPSFEPVASIDPPAIPAPPPTGTFRVDGAPPVLVGAQVVPAERVAPAPPEPVVTGAGLAKRVPGARRPGSGVTASVRSARTGESVTAPERARLAGEARAANVASLLTAFTSGVARGRDDAAAVPDRVPAGAAHEPSHEPSTPDPEIHR